MGTPAEEGGGGKIKLLDRGAFQDIDAATMVHPTSGTTRIAGRCTATHDMAIEYHGQGAHAASQPFKGKMRWMPRHYFSLRSDYCVNN